jgi:hypothetical protein
MTASHRSLRAAGGANCGVVRAGGTYTDDAGPSMGARSLGFVSLSC